MSKSTGIKTQERSLAVSRDTRQAKAALQEQMRLMKTITDNATLGLLMMDNIQHCTFMNPAAEKITGYTFQEVRQLSRPLHEVIHHTRPDGSFYPMEECPIDRALPEKNQTQGEDVFVKPDGSFYKVAFSASPIIKNNKPVGTVIEIRDITEERRAEAALQESRARLVASENQYRQLVDLSPDGIAVHAKGSVVYVNRAAAALVGAKSPDELIDQPIMRFVHPDYVKKVKARVQASLSTGRPTPLLEEKFLRLDGVAIDVEVVSIPITYQKQPAIQVVIRDITERKQAEAALKQSEERFRFMAESMPQKVFTADIKGNVDYFNPQWIEYTGLSFEQIRDWGWVQFIHPEDVEDNIARWQYSIDSGEPFAFEHRFRRHDSQYRWHISRAQAMRDEAGNTVRWFGSNTDIHDVKLAQQRESELEVKNASLTEQRRQLVELNKAKDEFISLASHQLRTPATAVKQYLGMVLEGYVGELTETQREMLSHAQHSNERQLHIVNDLLKVAQVDAGNLELNKTREDLAPLVKEVIEEQRSVFAERKQAISFETEYQKLCVQIDRPRLRMVLENLIDNASKYSPIGKRVRVRLERAGGRAAITIQDEGVGINPEDADKLFRKFSRLNNSLSVSVGGSGLGLYWAKKIIDLHGGTIEVDSVPGEGATFTICLPAAAVGPAESSRHG